MQNEPFQNEKSPLVRKIFRISVDIETIINAEPEKTIGSHQEHVQFHQELVQRLLAQPAVLHQLLRFYARKAFKQAAQMVTSEYGWDELSDQQLLQPIIEELEPAAQAYFTEEIEAGVSVFYFDAYQATIKHISMTELDEK